jgi:hypothetical protein
MIEGLSANIDLAWMLQRELLREAEEYRRHRPERGASLRERIQGLLLGRA